MNSLNVLVSAYKNAGSDVLIFSDSFELIWRNHPESGFMCGGESISYVIGERPLMDNGSAEYNAVYGGKSYRINIFECPFDDELFYAAEVLPVSNRNIVEDPEVRRLLDCLAAQVSSSLNNAGFALDNLAKGSCADRISQLNVIDDSLMGIYRTVLPFRELLDLYEDKERPVCSVSDVLEKLCSDVRALMPSVKINKNIMAGVYAKCTAEALSVLLYNFIERAFAYNYGCLMVNCITNPSGDVQITLTAAGEGREPSSDCIRYEETGGSDPSLSAEDSFEEQFRRRFGAVCVMDNPSDFEIGRTASMAVRIPIERAGSLMFNSPVGFEPNMPVGRFHPLRVKLSGRIKFPRFNQGEKYEA